jgi:Flp pilus assembly protein TadG
MRPTPANDRDRGVLTIVTLMLAVVTLAGAGLVVDGGRALTARRHAANTAEAAARFAVSSQSPLTDLDEAAATERATSFAIRSGVEPGDVAITIRHDAGGAPEIAVTVTERPRAVFLALGGITTMSVRATGIARFVYSI